MYRAILFIIWAMMILLADYQYLHENYIGAVFTVLKVIALELLTISIKEKGERKK